MTGRCASREEVLAFGSPAAYGMVSWRRRLRQELATYVAMASGIALPTITWLLQGEIRQEGAILAGEKAQGQFAAAAVGLAAVAAAVGWLQVQLLVSRMLQKRHAELRLVALLAGSWHAAVVAAALESMLQALLGAALGIAVAIAVFLPLAPSLEPDLIPRLMTSGLLGFSAAASAVLFPCGLSLLRLMRDDGQDPMDGGA